MADWDVVDQTTEPDDNATLPANSQPTSDDEWSVVGQSPGVDASSADDGWQVASHDDPQSPLGTFAEHAAARAPIGAVAGVAGLKGAAAGFEAGAAAAPFLGPLAPAAPIAGAVIGGLGAAAGAAWLASKPLDWIYDKLGIGESLGTGAQDNPTAAFLGDLTGNTLPAFGMGAASAGVRAGGAAIGAGVEGASEYANEGSVSPGKVLAAGAAGAAFPRARGWAEGAAARIPGFNKGTGTGAIQNPVAEEGQPGRPDLKAIPTEGADADDITVANDITTTSPGVAADNPPVPQVDGAGNPTGAPMSERTAARPNDPARNYGKGAQTSGEGVSTQESTVISTAPMHEDIAAALATEPPAENGPAQQAPAPQTTGQQQGEVQPEAGSTPAQPPQAAAQPTAPETPGKETDQGLVARATQRGMRRPTIFQPMPSIANSGKARNSPVVIDPIIRAEFPEAVRPLAVHETVEQALMAEGVPYDQAHKAATAAERDTLERWTRGIPWDEYTERMAGLAKKIESQKVDPETYAHLDLHVDPQEAIGHHGAGAKQEPIETGLDVTAKVTPQEQQAIDAGHMQLDEAIKGRPEMKAVKDRIAAMPPKQQAVAFDRMRAEIEREAASQPQNRQSMENGTKQKSHAEVDRKQKALNAWELAYKQHGPESAEKPDLSDKASVLELARKAVATAKEANGGVDPVKAYRPTTSPVERNWLKAARDAATKPTPANIKAFVEAHVLEGEVGKNIDADIALKVRPDVETANIGKADETRGRHELFEPFTDPEHNESEVYVQQQNTLRKWLNDLEDTDGRLLDQVHPDLVTEVETTQDPKELLMNLQDALAEAQKKRPGVLEYPAEDVPGKPKPIRNKADLDRFEPTEPGAKASEGKSLKGTPEFEELAKKYGSQIDPKQQPRNVDERIEAEQRAFTRAEPVDGSWDAFKSKVAEFAGDESGAGRVPKWLMPQPHNPSSPQADPGAKGYADSLSKAFSRLSAMAMNKKTELSANIGAAPKLTPSKWRKITLAEQDNKLGGLDPELKKVYDDYVSPIATEAKQVLRDLKTLNEDEGLGLDIPNLNAVTTKAYQPRYMVGKQHWDSDEDAAFDPYVGRTLSAWAPNAERRDWFSLEGDKGTRLTFNVGKNKDGETEVKIWRKGAPTPLKGLPDAFTGEIGQTLRLNVKGAKENFTVDQATTPEIERDTAGQVKFHENSLYAWSRALDDLNKAYENAKLTTAIRNDPEFIKNTTTKLDEAKERGYLQTPTHLPQLAMKNGKPIYMDNAIRYVLDDFHKPGFGPNEAVEKVRAFNTAVLKSFYTFTPFVHALNELDLFVVSRGFKWLSPQGYRDLAVYGVQAFKDVNAQGAIQREIRSNGGNPMLASVQMRDLYLNAAKKFGLEITSNASKWDPVAKAWGVTTPQLARAAYNASSDITWRLSDYLLTIRYLEEKAAGRTPAEAVAKAHEFISDYQLKSTVLGSRTLQQILADQATTAFGRYKAGVFTSYANMTKRLIKGTPSERTEALGQLMAAGTLAWVLYPALDKLVQKVSGNDEADIRRRGFSTVPHALSQMAQGDKAIPVQNIWSPSVALTTAADVARNKDFAGKEILPRVDYRNPRSVGDAAANATDYAARTVFPPYNTFAQQYRKPGSSVGSIAGGIAAEQVGAHLPSDAEKKYNAHIEKTNNAAAKARERRPSGVIPDIYYRLTR